LDPSVSKEAFLAAIADNTIQDVMRSFPAPAGTSVFVAAGTVHAIGSGILLAEIQQNSDLTYRIYDWDRVDEQGNGRELHLEKAAQVTHFGSHHGGAAVPLMYKEKDVSITILGACRHFATALIEAPGRHTRHTHGRSFHLLLARDGHVVVSAGDDTITLERGGAVLVPGGIETYSVEGEGAVLDFFVPDLLADIVEPLRSAGHADAAIIALGGDVSTSDVAKATCP
jgi:mannose-6-phosphate isomerase